MHQSAIIGIILLISRNRRRAVLLPIGLLMLCMAVFGWGLQYKLSLYKGKDSVSHLAPVAKLLSQKERPTTGQAIAALADPPVWPVFLMLALGLGLAPADARLLRSGSREEDPDPLPPPIRALFLRPPPIALSLL
jgi:hypothetical protein